MCFRIDENLMYHVKHDVSVYIHKSYKYMLVIYPSKYIYIQDVYLQDPHGQDIDIMYISLYVSCISISSYIMSMHDITKYIFVHMMQVSKCI
jgi:hypothetical protein